MNKKVFLKPLSWLLISFVGVVVYKRFTFQGFPVPQECGIVFIVAGIIMYIFKIKWNWNKSDEELANDDDEKPDWHDIG